MKINFSAPVRDKDGKPFGVKTPCLVVNEQMEIVWKDKEKGIPQEGFITDKVLQKNMLEVALESLVTEVVKPNVQPDNKKRIERYELYKKLQKAKRNGCLIVDVTVEEAVLLKEVVGDCQTVLSYGQFLDLIDGKVEKENEDEEIKNHLEEAEKLKQSKKTK